MEKTYGEISATIDKLFEEKNYDELEIFIRENPNFARGYIERETLEINLKLTHINWIVTVLSARK